MLPLSTPVPPTGADDDLLEREPQQYALARHVAGDGLQWAVLLPLPPPPMRFVPAAVAALALAVAGCQLGPRPVATPPPAGDWAVVSMQAGERVLRDPQAALSRQGQVLRFEPDRAVSGPYSCENPRYLANLMVADRYLHGELGLRHHDLGLYRHQDVRITEVYCGGRKWRPLGGTVLWVSDTQGFAVSDGVVYELRPVPVRQ